MFGKKKPLNPEVKEAIGRRDELLGKVQDAVQEVGSIVDDLIEEYKLAEEQIEEGQWT